MTVQGLPGMWPKGHVSWAYAWRLSSLADALEDTACAFMSQGQPHAPAEQKEGHLAMPASHQKQQPTT